MDDGSDRTSILAWAAPCFTSFGPAGAWGMDEGVTFGYRLSDHLGLIASGSFWENGISTEFLGTLGVQRFGNPNGDSFAERASVWLLWDQFADTSIADAYTSQLRCNFGMAYGENREVGMSFATHIGGFTGGAPQNPLGGPGVLSTGSGFVGPYAKRDMGDYHLTGMVGWEQSSDNVALGIGAERPVGQNLNVFLDTKYGFEGSWSVSAGLQVGLLRADTKHY
jgi:hypothetical protein